MKTCKMIIEVFENKKTKHECDRCGEQAVAKIIIADKKEKVISYLCDDCAKKTFQEGLEEIEKERTK